MSLPIPQLPSTLGAFSISSANYTCHLPPYFDSDEEIRQTSIYFSEFEGIDGAIKTRNTSLQPIEMELVGYIMDPTTADNFRKVAGERSVVLSRDGRNLAGEVTGYSCKETVTGELWATSITIQDVNGCWLGDTATSATDPTNVTNEGDLNAWPTFTFTGGVGGATVCSVTVGGRPATYTGTVASGEVLVIDAYAGTAKLDGANVLNGMNGSFFTDPPYLETGLNAIAINNTGSATLTISHVERYL